VSSGAQGGSQPRAETTTKPLPFVDRLVKKHGTSQIQVLWKLYRWKCIILIFWTGSRDQTRKALKFLYCSVCVMGLLKAQNRNCTIAALGSSIAALIGITTMAIFIDLSIKVHWLCRASWNFSVFCAFLSAFFACKHTNFINNILLEDSGRAWRVKKWFHSGKKDDDAHPPFATVLLLSGTEAFFDTAVFAYIIGFSIFLGGVWQNNLEDSQTDSRNIFVLYLVSGIFCFCVYFSLRFAPHTREAEEWDRFLRRLEDECYKCRRPSLCVMKVSATGEEGCINPDHFGQDQEAPCHDPCRDMRTNANSSRLMAEPREECTQSEECGANRRKSCGRCDRNYRIDSSDAIRAAP